MTMDIVSKLSFIFMFTLTEYVSGISLTSTPAQIKAPDVSGISLTSSPAQIKAPDVSGISLTSSPAQIKAPGQSLLVVSL
ncbi:hypothetical protein ROHU_032374 [Labeo rohita]|uniref:Uncharacterized protein n=1 Tax=Labeo rohita TaxID=84645 RepID=A0A498LL71_LABRO|nr:hypothetical protein ROHU_032374 [Labeo rohita]